MRSFLKPGIIISLFIFFYLLYLIQGGIREHLELRKERERLEKNLMKESALNQKLGKELKFLHTDSYIEGIARERLGLVKPGEIAYKVIKK